MEAVRRSRNAAGTGLSAVCWRWNNASEMPFVLLLSLLTALAVPLLAQITLESGVTLVVSQGESTAVRRAASDLAADLEAALGRPPLRAERVPPNHRAIVVGLRENVPKDVARPGAPESLLIQAHGKDVLLTGADERGVIYAVYEFARLQLGVDPLYWWTDHAPTRRTRLTIPASYRYAPPPAVFRYRGWFINDEDLLTGWRPAVSGGTEISLEVWDRIFEAILRLRGNMVVPGTFIFPDEPQVKAASERGLIISQHHIEVLGTNTWRWPNDKPYSFASSPQLLVNAWRNSMRGYGKDQEVLWTVGYRGRHDRAFWLDDTSTPPTPQARGAAIRKAIDRQMQIVRAERTGPHFIMNAWMEAVGFLREGHLKLPQDVTLVWPDNGHGILSDGGAIGRGQGVYYHTAMHDFRSNQLTERVPLSRIERELGRAARAGATEYLLVNVSDVRPYVMTTRAVMELAVEGEQWKAAPFLDRWCKEEFGERASAAATEYYRGYFDAPGRYGTREDDALSDTGYHNYLRFILVSLIRGRPETSDRFIRISDWDSFLKPLLQATQEADPRWVAAGKLAMHTATLVPPGRKQFYQSHVVTQWKIHEHSNRALRFAAEAWYDRPHAPQRIAQVIEELKSVLAAFQAAEYGKWKGYYAGDKFVDVRGALRLAEACADVLAGRPLPADVELRPLPKDPYFWLKSYQADRWVDVN